MRIVQVNAFYYPYRGGIEHRIHQFSKRLSKRNEVIILTSRLPGTSAEEKMDGYRVVRLDSRYVDIYNPPYVRTPGLMDELDRLDPDVVDFHFRWSPSYAEATRRYEGKKVFTFHNTFGEGVGLMHPFSVLNDTLWRRNIGHCSRVVCVSDFVRTDLINHRFDSTRLVTVPNGIDAPPDVAVPEEDFILFVGRLVATKGLSYLVQAMKRVDSKLIICGEGPERSHLARLIGRYGLGDKVELAGHVIQETRDKLLSSCKVFVMPSLFESYGIAVAEAMSLGRPVVASNVGGLPEVVRDAGLYSRPKDSDDIADQINKLLEDPAERHRLGTHARELALTYSWDKRAQEMEALYSEVAKAG